MHVISVGAIANQIAPTKAKTRRLRKKMNRGICFLVSIDFALAQIRK